MRKKLWFKRKLFGWGWYPCSWEGWVTVLIFLILVVFFAGTIDEASSSREVMFTFVLPLAILVSLLIRICYVRGEKPCWQWGKRRDDCD